MRYLVFSLPLLVLLSLVGACGDDDDTTPTATTLVATATAPPLETPTSAPTSAPTPAATAAAGFSLQPQQVPGAAGPPDIPVVTDVRIGAHPEEGGFDRIVFEFDGALPSATVDYVSDIAQCGSGFPVTLAGDHILRVRMTPANAHDEAGNLTVPATELDGTGQSILQAKGTCDFEADVTWALGIAGEKPFRVTTLTDPTRLVIDVQH
jgi:hypothetical protein